MGVAAALRCGFGAEEQLGAPREDGFVPRRVAVSRRAAPVGMCTVAAPATPFATAYTAFAANIAFTDTFAFTTDGSANDLCR